MPALRRLVGNERTVLEFCGAPDAIDATRLSPSLYTLDFQTLTQQLPLTICVRGVVTSVQEEIVSLAGNPMQNFKLHDNTGKYVNCVAFGRHVDNVCVANQNDVVLYFATAQKGLNDGYGQLWMYDDSHIACLGAGRSAPPSLVCMELR